MSAVVDGADRDLLIAAALLHDVGYAPALATTGFHPLDGARFLAVEGWPPRLVSLVAHHSGACTLAAPRGLGGQLAAFPRETGPVADALTYADVTSGPDGRELQVAERLADMHRRHADAPPRELAARRAREPELVLSVARVEARLAAAGICLPTVLTPPIASSAPRASQRLPSRQHLLVDPTAPPARLSCRRRE